LWTVSWSERRRTPVFLIRALRTLWLVTCWMLNLSDEEYSSYLRLIQDLSYADDSSKYHISQKGSKYMKVMTVVGTIRPEELGITQIHEHICVDLRCNSPQCPGNVQGSSQEQRVDASNIDILHQDPYAISDNLVLDDEDLAVQELSRFKGAGGNTVVEMSNTGIGRDAQFLRRVAKGTGLNIIMSCGYYVAKCHPKSVETMTVEEIAEQMLAEVLEGADGTDIKAGIIGEIGTSEEILPQERRVLIASATVHKKTGLSIAVHLCPGAGHAFEVLDILENEGVDPSRIILLHLEDSLSQPSFLSDCEAVAKRGAYFGFFAFGHVYSNPRWSIPPTTDDDRIRVLLTLVEKGFISQILLSCDVCFKMNLFKYGGGGYGHILINIIPRLRQLGFSDLEVNNLLIDNPRKLLSF